MSKILTKKHYLGVVASTFISVFLVAGFVFAAVTVSTNIQLGSGTPDVTLNGDDLYATGTFEVDGAARFDGATTLTSTLDAESYMALGNGSALDADITFLVDRDFTATASNAAAQLDIPTAIITEASSGTHARLAGVSIGAPTFTSGNGETTDRTTLYIAGAPTGTATSTNVYAFHVDGGATQLDGAVTLASTLDAESYMALGNGSALDADFTLLVDRDFTATAGENAAQLSVPTAVITEGASGTHTRLAAFEIGAPTFTGGNGETTSRVTAYIAGAPTGTATSTNVYALWVDDGAVQIDSTLTVGGETNLDTLVFGGVSTALTATTTLTAAQMCNSAYFSIDDVDDAETTAGLTTANAADLIADCIATIGDTKSFMLQNTATTSLNVTVIAGTAIELIEPSGGDVIIVQNEWADFKFINYDGTNVAALVTSVQDAD